MKSLRPLRLGGAIGTGTDRPGPIRGGGRPSPPRPEAIAARIEGKGVKLSRPAWGPSSGLPGIPGIGHVGRALQPAKPECGPSNHAGCVALAGVDGLTIKHECRPFSSSGKNPRG